MNHLTNIYVELFKRKEFDIFCTLDGKLHEKQREALFILTDNQTKEFAYGGAAGGAKSWTGALWLVLSCLAYPDTRYFVGREELKRLRESTLITIFRVAKSLGCYIDIEYKYNGQDHYILFNNGSRIDLLDLKLTPSDPLYERYGSIEYTSGWIEEAGEVDFGAFDTLKTRVNRYNNQKYNILGRIFCTLNPKKNWCKTEFYDLYKLNELPNYRRFLIALATDNPFLSKEYIESLHQITDKVKKQRLLYGNFEYDDDDDCLTSYDAVNNIFYNKYLEDGVNYISSDIAITNDRFVVVAWSGMKIKEIVCLKNASKPIVSEQNGIMTTVVDYKPLTDTLEAMSIKYKVPRSNIVYDADGIGNNITKTFPGAVALNNGSAPVGGKIEYVNLKAQLYYRLAEEINKGNLAIDCYVDNEIKKSLSEELMMIKRSSDSGEKLAIMKKAKVKELLGRSPDIADAIMFRMLFLITRGK